MKEVQCLQLPHRFIPLNEDSVRIASCRLVLLMAEYDRQVLQIMLEDSMRNGGYKTLLESLPAKGNNHQRRLKSFWRYL